MNNSGNRLFYEGVFTAFLIVLILYFSLGFFIIGEKYMFREKIGHGKCEVIYVGTREGFNGARFMWLFFLLVFGILTIISFLYLKYRKW